MKQQTSHQEISSLRPDEKSGLRYEMTASIGLTHVICAHILYYKSFKMLGSPFRGLGFFLFLFFPFFSFSQTITGKVVDEDSLPIAAAKIVLANPKDTIISKTNKQGNFSITATDTGLYYLTVSAHGYDEYKDSVTMSKAPEQGPDSSSGGVWGLGVIRLLLESHPLDEVKVVEKVLAMVQKDDTLEFNSRAFKVNPDADAADLVRKMPSIEINGQVITAQGENVVKILVDGKPFFGADPYASLKNLPADMIDKVQVYNEKSDQERFTGFSEGATSKTINLITKPDKRNGLFGKLYGGYGSDNSDDGKYGAGTTLNQFGGDQRITLTGQSNNINIQNFTSDNSNAAAGGGGAGIVKTNAGGINYNDKWGTKTDVSGSYFFSETNSSMEGQLRRTYLLSVDSGQVFNQSSPSANQGYSHRFNMRLNYAADTMNSILWQPTFSLNKNNSNSQQAGNTVEALTPINNTTSSNQSNNTGLSFTNNILLRHKFHKRGRTFSMNLNAGNNGNDGTTIHTAQNIYYTSPSLSDTLNQQTLQKQNTWNLTGNATYTEPTANNGLLKLEYNISYLPASAQRNTDDYSYTANNYSLPNDQYSNVFYSRNIAHRAGASYQVNMKKVTFSAGLNYQLTQLYNNQSLPVSYRLSQNFQNWLPTATLHYKCSKTQNLQATYNTNTQAPSVGQLQNVINNIDPLHLYTGNPALKQPYRHNLTLRYNATSNNAKNSFSASLTGAVTQHAIATNSIIATHDTTITQNIILATGSQLTMPVNINGNRSLSGNISYGMPLSSIKCHLNLSLNAGMNQSPSIINNVVNEQENKNAGLGASIGSNISENVDFLLSSNVNVVSNENSINRQLNTTYINGTSKASINLILWKGIVVNTAINYQSNSGLSAGYNQDYLLWNLSVGKKLFKKRQGDIRLSFFDLLNENNNIQHTITDTYIQDSRSNIQQRYFLLVFTWKINHFKKQQPQ